jgi:hypothetical protein
MEQALHASCSRRPGDRSVALTAASVLDTALKDRCIWHVTFSKRLEDTPSRSVSFRDCPRVLLPALQHRMSLSNYEDVYVHAHIEHYRACIIFISLPCLARMNSFPRSAEHWGGGGRLCLPSTALWLWWNFKSVILIAINAVAYRLMV